MPNISEQIIGVLKSHNIYLEKADIIDKYLLTFSSILNETDRKLFNKIGTVFSTDTENEDTKKYVNRKLAA